MANDIYIYIYIYISNLIHTHIYYIQYISNKLYISIHIMYILTLKHTHTHIHTHTHTHIYIYIYVCVCVCIFRQHFFVNANFIKHNRHFMPTYFLLDPFEFPYYFYPRIWSLEITHLPRLGCCKKPTLYINLNVP